MQKINTQRTVLRGQLLRGKLSRKPAALQITLSGRAARKLFDYLSSPTPRELPSPAPRELSSPIPHKQEITLRPTLRPWVEIIDQIIKEDAPFPRRVRKSAMQIFKKLREEHGYMGCYGVVQDYIYRARNPAVGPRSSPRSKNNQPKAKNPLVKTRAVSAKIEEYTNPAPSKREALHSAYTAISPLRQQQDSDSAQISSVLYCRTFRPTLIRQPEEQAYAWMRCIQQGTIPLDILANELSDVPLHEMEMFHSAATEGSRSIRNKSIAVMSYFHGIDWKQICSFLQISSGSFFRYWRTYRESGIKTLLSRKQRCDKLSANEAVRSEIFALLHSPPSAHGINRTTWTIPDLERILSEEKHPAGGATIREVIKDAGFKWRHARVVLTSNDPDYRAKVEAITKILSELKPDEAFFSIDEYGPFAIKIKGGKKRVAPDEQYVVPQWQKSKGWMILTAALELSKNQISHFYSRKKNTAEMITMADLLRNQYRTYSTIYLSWDAASWHVSKDLVAHLEEINQRAASDGFPVVKTAPLPAGAQFLNVIESVFSGMARAIIHNSDYPSAETAREAIDRYFADRNKYFFEHPKKAGQKIWGKERVPSVFTEGQNCKDPMYQYIA